jgi:hypothetical protein
MEQMVEAGARALCAAEIRIRRRWDTEPDVMERMLPAAVDYAWNNYVQQAEAALRAALPMAIEAALRGAEGKSAEFDSQTALAECRDAEYGFHQGRVAVVTYIRTRLSEIMEGK